MWQEFVRRIRYVIASTYAISHVGKEDTVSLGSGVAAGSAGHPPRSGALGARAAANNLDEAANAWRELLSLPLWIRIPPRD